MEFSDELQRTGCRPTSQSEQVSQAGAYGIRSKVVGRISDLTDDLEKQAEQLNRMLREETIRTRAHQIWEEHNCPAGRDEEFWLQAERELDGGSSQRHSLC